MSISVQTGYAITFPPGINPDDFLPGGGGGPVVPTNDLMTLGDSITEGEQQAGTSPAQRQTGLIMNLAGTGEILTGLAQAGWPLQFDAYNDTAGTQPSLLGNPLKYFKGGNFAQAGATIAAIGDQIDYAHAQGYNPKAIILGGGTNSLPLVQADHLALIDKVLGYWPTAIIGVQNVRPTTAAGAGTGNRSVVNITDANTKIAANVASRASSGGGVSLINVYDAYANRGTGGQGQTADFQDGLHPSVQGASGAGAKPHKAWFLANFPSATDKSEAHKIASILTTAQSAFTGVSYAVNVAGAASPNDGTIVGNMPTGLTIAKVGNVKSNIVPSIVNRGDGTFAIRLAITKVAGNATEQCRIYDTGINASITSVLAGVWFESVATVADDQNVGWKYSRLSWLERSNTAGNTENSFFGLAQDGSTPIAAGGGPLTATSGARITKIVSAPKKGELTSNGSQREIAIQWDPSVAETMTIDIQLMDIRTRTAPQGAI